MASEAEWLRVANRQLSSRHLVRRVGRVMRVIGHILEVAGPKASLGELCALSGEENQTLGEVLGFREGRLYVVPLGPLPEVSPGAPVLFLEEQFRIRCGPGLVGRVLDGLGNPIDDRGPLSGPLSWRPVNAPAIPPLRRGRIDARYETGVRAIDGLLTIGRGQRLGLFAGSGVGKSTLLSMMARGGGADVNVIALVGERGREVREFLEDDLGEEGMQQSVVVVSTSDEPAYVRSKAAFVATAIAEYFRDQGMHVALFMDSLTRFAMAEREVGLAMGEPPSSRGYTPSVFAKLPVLLERAGPGSVGAITAIYTVLIEGDDVNDPVADAVRGILDGHVVLSRGLANRGQFPAIDVLQSLSRLFPSIASEAHQRAARRVREWLARYAEIEDLLRIGAYRPGADPDADEAIRRMPDIIAFLRQSKQETVAFEQAMDQLFDLVGDAS
ncbi:FliI/YscN family ATPase [Alicyclobacillus vulcanalis]|uniref:Type III secretion system ATPase, FliI/YscN n=1 Tax=Alicyclobacillus vulcanalis TaxID=252246 RepID=A0A1N7MXM2_9BACL|nr:FliI/YscN family ATPase [Alicyclobacillus vulcanalis]SIS90629.1 type III secretion system ATPase, FliI/YscN [Alicyclobacillus vulcanalis]